MWRHSVVTSIVKRYQLEMSSSNRCIYNYFLWMCCKVANHTPIQNAVLTIFDVSLGVICGVVGFAVVSTRWLCWRFSVQVPVLRMVSMPPMVVCIAPMMWCGVSIAVYRYIWAIFRLLVNADVVSGGCVTMAWHYWLRHAAPPNCCRLAMCIWNIWSNYLLFVVQVIYKAI